MFFFVLFCFVFYFACQKWKLPAKMIDMMGRSYGPGCNCGLRAHAYVKFEA